MVEKMSQCLYKGTTSTALLIGLKKAFYCLPQVLWIDKLHASEIEENFKIVIGSYRKQIDC